MTLIPVNFSKWLNLDDTKIHFDNYRMRNGVLYLTENNLNILPTFCIKKRSDITWLKNIHALLTILLQDALLKFISKNSSS